jgi:RNA polymerase sigma-70 factor (ECF subfamily)
LEAQCRQLAGFLVTDARVIPLRKEDERLKEEARAAERIVKGILEGKTAAETELVERYSRGLRFLLMRRSGDEERARDLLQETFLIAFRKLREKPLEKPERLAGYLKGIADNVARSGGRKRMREPLSMEPEAIAAIPDKDVRAFQNISSEQTGAAVKALLEEMPVERDREILRRYYIYDENKPEICKALELDSLHFNRVLHRAKGRFRKILEESGVRSDISG